MASRQLALPDDYPELLAVISERVRGVRFDAALAVNQARTLLYWEIGCLILERQRVIGRGSRGYGAAVIKRLSADLTKEFRDATSFSPRNLQRMRAFAAAWPEKVPQPVALSPWGHNVVLNDRLDDPDLRLWYAQKTVENGWSRNVLVHQIDSRLHERQGAALATLERTLPAPQSELMQQIVKDPYDFSFLGLEKEAAERQVEQGLVDRVCEMLLEFGRGFAFVGRQVRLDVDGDEFFIDLLFYFLSLHCYVAVELKVEDFKPEFAGKLSFYTAVVDDQVRDRTVDGPTVGLLLCRGRNDAVARYSLSGMTTPMVVSTYTHRKELPQALEEALPSERELEARLSELD